MTYVAPETEQMEVRMETNFLASQEAMSNIVGTAWDEDAD